MESPLRPGAPGAWPDLPFFWLDFRRLLRKGALWRVLLITVALPAGAFALTAGVLTLLGGPEGRPGWPPGPILFSVVAVFHGLGMLSLVTRLLTLHGEAAADRLDQLRLLPYTRQQLMLNLAGGRALLRLFTLAAPLPVYLLLMAYGSVALSDLVGLYFLLGLGLYGIPGRLEVTTALTSRTLQQGQSREQGNPAVSMVAILLASSFQLLAPVLGRVMLQFFRGLEEAVRTVAGPDYLASLPGSLVGLCGQLVVTPLPFFGLPVHPLIPILAYSALRTVARLVDSSELWSREVQAGNGMVGVNSAVLLPETGRTDEQQRLAWLHAAQAVLLAVLLLGYLWNSTITTGTLGKLSGSATAGGALAACLVLWCGLHLSLRCEAL
ncbi:MAG: hypothetical protein FJX77_11535, partial [Armatimonadetes bacterium]|nr:hypothetical protein [Armatimonadota bacterium]